MEADDAQSPEAPALTKWPRSPEWQAYQRLSSTRTESSLAAILFSALAVEAFLNTIGVARLGENFYHHNCERLRVHEKLAFLVGALGHVLVEPTDEVAKSIKAVFESRNRVAHPKTKQVDIADPKLRIESQNLLAEARAGVTAMLLFFEQFVALVPETKVHLRHNLKTGASREEEND